MRPGGLAVVVGAIGGVALAFASRSRTPAPPEARQQAAVLAPSPSATPTDPPLAPASPSPSPSPNPAPAPDPDIPPPLPAPLPLAPSRLIPELPPLPPPTTPKELEQSELRCYERKDPEECERAASSYESGTLVPADAPRIARLRRVATTFLVRRCENDRSPHACLALANRYLDGKGVAQSNKKALQLFEHARDLCHERPRRECEDGEPK